MRIVSTVPSLTELLCHLGLHEQLVGVTKFCVHPAYIREESTIIGGTKNLRLDTIRDLGPDIIIANKEENDRKQIESLSETIPIHLTEIKNVEDALQAIHDIGEITGTIDASERLIVEIKNRRERFLSRNISSMPSVLYLIWRDPYMSIGGDTYIHSILDELGVENLCADRSRYPILLSKEIHEIKPDWIFLSSEPFPFKKKHIVEYQQLVPEAQIRIVDGESFSWYGSRLLYAYDYLDSLRSEMYTYIR